MSKIIRAPRVAQRQGGCTLKHDRWEHPALSCLARTSSVVPHCPGTPSALTPIRSIHHSQVRS